MLQCKKFPDNKCMINRCKKLKLCFNCPSQKNNKSQCKKPIDYSCNFCKSQNHISALCSELNSKLLTNYCPNNTTNSGNFFLLSVVTVTLSCGNKPMKSGVYWTPIVREAILIEN